MLRMRRALLALPALLTLVAGGCDILLGLDNPQPLPPSTTTTTTTTGTLCDPGSVEECGYSGPEGTKGIGACRAATRTCNDIGSAYGACDGEVLPKPEDCATSADDDCDGVANEADAGCACIPGQTEACYSGPAATLGVGTCKSGLRTCNPDGLGLGPCLGETLPVAEDCNATGDEDCNFAGIGCSEAVWSANFGDGANQIPWDVAVDAMGNSYVLGVFTGAITFGQTTLVSVGAKDIFLVKFSPDGKVAWARQYGDETEEFPTSLAVNTSGDVVIAGNFMGTIDFGDVPLTSQGNFDIFVAKLSPSGSVVWAKRFGDTASQSVGDVAVDTEGNIVVAGNFNGTLDSGNQLLTSQGGGDAFLMKLSPAGSTIWAKSFGDNMYQTADRVAVDTAGNIALAGSFSGDISFGNIPISATDEDAYLALFNADGGYTCSRRFDAGKPSILGPEVTGIAIDSQGFIALALQLDVNISLGGEPLPSVGQYDVAIAKFSPACNHEWSYRWGGGGFDGLPVLSFRPDDQLMVALVSNGPVDVGSGPLVPAGGMDVILGMLDAAGAVVWAKRYGDDMVQSVPRIATGPQGETLIACQAQGTIDFSNGPLAMGADSDVVVAMIAP